MGWFVFFGILIVAGLAYHYREAIKKTLKVTYEEITGRDWD